MQQGARVWDMPSPLEVGGLVQVIRCKHKIRSFSEVLHPRKGQLCGLAISLGNNMVEVSLGAASNGPHSVGLADLLQFHTLTPKPCDANPQAQH